ncbi:SoxY-related AACIE arm protein [Rhizobacter sp. Root16D2]|nr:SoxY-related AACIE arm protein [Rhizobacter sp. Root16D2]KQU67321.1 sulfur oxidation protein SoxY [Rhizobacter sp. Root29]KQV98319.1 sulfur oxidation protein SoxY [Rhizobacter sp. Root1238]KRB02231.1 sulfur oxidation protein SoxY [Rhizobacter sp. Root16D2]
MHRRVVLQFGLAAGGLLLVRPARATRFEMQSAIADYASGSPVKPGKVTFDIPPLVENGNGVPITVSVDSPMTAAEHVTGIAVFNERNPQRDVVRFTLGPRAGRAVVSTRIRLATSQQLVAVARLSDGTFWSQGVDVLVTLAACLE